MTHSKCFHVLLNKFPSFHFKEENVMQTLIRILVFEEYGVMSNEPHQRSKIRVVDKTLLPTQIIYIYTRILLLT